MTWSSKQHSMVSICIHEQELIQLRMVVLQNRLRGPWKTTWSGKAPPLLICQGSKCDHRSQTISGNCQQRCCNSITVTMVHNAAHAPIQHAHTIQAWTRSIYNWHAILLKSHWSQRSGHSWYEHQHTYTQHSSWHLGMHICGRHQKYNECRCRTADTMDIHNKRLVAGQRWFVNYSMRILSHKAWTGNNWLCSNEG